MLTKLKKLIKQHGIVQVSNELGYRSLNTVNNWIKKSKIPNTAIKRVEGYLKGKE